MWITVGLWKTPALSAQREDCAGELGVAGRGLKAGAVQSGILRETAIVVGCYDLKQASEVALNYPWQQAVSDAFAASREALPAKINVAERAIATRLADPKQPDAFERIALGEALRSLKNLVVESRPQPVPQQASHFHIRWSSGAVDWERFDTRAEAQDSANQLARPSERYTIEESGHDCPPCRDFLKKKLTSA